MRKMYYEDAKENAVFERCTDVITNMIIKYGPLLKRKWAVEEWLRNIHVGCFWKELAVKRYGRYVENMKKWKFGLEKSTAWQYQIDLHMNQIYNKVKMIMT